MFISRKVFEEFKDYQLNQNKRLWKRCAEIEDRLDLLLKSVHGEDAVFGNDVAKEVHEMSNNIENWLRYDKPLPEIRPSLIIEKVKKGEDKHTQIYPKLK